MIRARKFSVRSFALTLLVGYTIIPHNAAVAQVALTPAQRTAAFNELQTAGAYSTVLTTLNAGFFSQGSAVTTVPNDPTVNQFGRGGWVRVNAGLFDIKSTASLVGTPASNQINARTTYGGIQGGVDLGHFNLGGTGFNVVYGLTGGEVGVKGSARATAGSADYDIPFGGAYLVMSKAGFVAEVSYRHDFVSSILNDPGTGLFNKNVNGQTNTGAVSLSYKRSLPGAFFVEPSVAFTASRFTTDGIFIPIAIPAPGVFQASPINSDLGRAGLRVGKDFNFGGIVVEPFAAASVWREFADPNSGSFTSPGFPILAASTTRVGTFGQYSLGFSAVANNGLLFFARGDLRSGQYLSGNTITGGLRYSF